MSFCRVGSPKGLPTRHRVPTVKGSKETGRFKAARMLNMA